MNALALLVVLAAHKQIAVIDSVHTRLSRIIQSTITEELRARSIDIGEGGYVAEIVDVSDAGGKSRQSQIARDARHSVQVTEVVGGAAADVRLYDGAHALVATYKLSGSGSNSASVGSTRGDVVTSFILAPLFRRSRSADAARAIGHDIAAQIVAAMTTPVADTPQR